MSDIELGQIEHRDNPAPDREGLLSPQIADHLAECPTYFEVYMNPKSWSQVVPGRRYKSTQDFRHKDSLGRVWIGPDDDRCLSATDGRLNPLVVHATEDIWFGPVNATWSRSKIEECTPTILRVVYSLLGPRIQKENLSIAWLISVCLSWIPCCLIIGALLFIPVDLGGEKRNNGRYEQFKYHYWGYSKFSANRHEIQPSSTNNCSTSYQITHGISKRNLRPRQLCLLQDDGIEIVDVNEWEAEHGTIDYLFICYTTLQFSHETNEDMDELHRIAESAARRAGVAAYWLACSCMPQDEERFEDVYRISDVVRGAHSLVVIIGPPQGSNPTVKEMLQQLGVRLWTFPEVLLSPSNRVISVYTRDCDTDSFRTLSKRNFTVEAWDDALISRELIDHYEASILLSPLELVSLALKCFPNREKSIYADGDFSYALMGLLRRRPKVNKEDSAFEAFCRLSLANDSDQLIERMICMLPRDIGQPWNEIDDFWDSKLWEIEPHCQVVGIGGEDTVILSGAFGAPIRWNSYRPVNLLMRNTVKRWVAKVVLRSIPAFLLIGVLLLAMGLAVQENYMLEYKVMGGIFTGFSVLVILASPYLICSLYVGKTWAAQPWLFGFEGYMEIGEIERLIFGINIGRLRWSPYSSDLSLHHEDENGECVGQDPRRRASTANFISTARRSQYGELKLFTLVDTNTFTVTLFRAVRPPVAMLLCGSEGGMQRALLCSYEWKSQTLFRETVLRVPTTVLERMSRVDRFRLGLKRSVGETVRADSVR